MLLLPIYAIFPLGLLAAAVPQLLYALVIYFVCMGFVFVPFTTYWPPQVTVRLFPHHGQAVLVELRLPIPLLLL